MKKIFLLYIIILIILTTQTAFAMIDDFDDNQINENKWTLFNESEGLGSSLVEEVSNDFLHIKTETDGDECDDGMESHASITTKYPFNFNDLIGQNITVSIVNNSYSSLLWPRLVLAQRLMLCPFNPTYNSENGVCIGGQDVFSTGQNSESGCGDFCHANGTVELEFLSDGHVKTYLDGVLIREEDVRSKTGETFSLQILVNSRSCSLSYESGKYSEWYIDFIDIPITIPKYSNNSTSSSVAGQPTDFTLKWNDDMGLSGYIFSFCNGTWNGTDCSPYTTIYSMTYQENASSIFITNTTENPQYTSSGYFYVNYSKPPNTVGALWQVKHGWDSSTGTGYTYNITLDNTYCWNYNPLQLRIVSECVLVTMHSYPQCYNGSDWINIGTDGGFAYGGVHGGGNILERMYDGNWDTHASWNNAANDWDIVDESQAIFEEAMWWNISSINADLINDNWISFPNGGIEDWSNVTKVINDTVGAVIAWRVYANDTSGNWNVSETYSFVTTDETTTTSTTTTSSTTTTILEDTTPPSFNENDTRPQPGEELYQGETVPIIVNVSENSTVLANITWDNASEGINLIFNNSSLFYESEFYNTTDLGNYTVTITATDQANNTNSTETWFSVIENTTTTTSSTTTTTSTTTTKKSSGGKGGRKTTTTTTANTTTTTVTPETLNKTESETPTITEGEKEITEEEKPKEEFQPPPTGRFLTDPTTIGGIVGVIGLISVIVYLIRAGKIKTKLE